ncbi:DUF3025 domain-containing protein [Azoarcus communis]|uniref:DUF3025 domain-containing protein n=1 Tax=Parazoarcus communis SWub3 = DSM 12120 TaxID=1121029 RepID=A0A323USC3_9RHOO|nr:DUF3025 domain-containing protein [Parazoarcus communis]NMG50596.1 DUF3025 domain-containing protein [Parazoarcus communis]NMG72345.1 DUF3025 domain-containing protein [Parazoarcus communis SWub3 = DSM 12120]PZA14913.1 DUF3025 domain-containing protein [Azoarcus communis] [Parazoarcus communis SWub3 = DSM 12120]
MSALPTAPAAYRHRILFSPIARFLAAAPQPGVPDIAALNAMREQWVPGLQSGSGAPLCFVRPPKGLDGYESHIHATGEVPTRADDWHDYFNALAWLAWPRSKQALNRLHVDILQQRQTAGLSGRGSQRDAMTQFDECGVVVVTADADLAAGLAAHEWMGVFWAARQRLIARSQFMVFGHASWDLLRDPFPGLCAKACYRVVDESWLALDHAARLADTDAWLADHLRAHANALSPASWRPLPLLGIPGVTSDNEQQAYYLDTKQFRPRRLPATRPC